MRLSLVTKKTNEINKYIAYIEELKVLKDGNNFDQTKHTKELQEQIKNLRKTNDILKKDNKAMKDIVDQIKLKLTVEIKHLLNIKDSQIKKSLIKLLDHTLG
ncbi:hypothetical protein I4641_09955 [Waterburya agarophytonicola K14]|uniref:Uncharacterized protein n=1 Tax=Waterburya agarophytonicola KI4 TaxID=2874699 RepID=A0A964FH55_9CYAN|nr:hypothetical protein [Waterburya agarophytonicola]MCC0177299.1 hypothetical protein [Waterburya agarophytonicola KI4]